MPENRPRAPKPEAAGHAAALDRFIGQIDLGGLPSRLVSRSIELLATQVAPEIRKATTTSPAGPDRTTRA